jgi:hypothetical protein
METEMKGDKAHPMGRRQQESPPHQAGGDVEGVRVSSIKVFNMAKISNWSGTRTRHFKKRYQNKENKKLKLPLGRVQ